MTFSHAVWVVVLCLFAGSYTWGMRGTILGGERGAMLPGAALALLLLYAGGGVPLTEAFPLAAVVGAAGMFFGGSQTYGETISMTHDPDASVRRLGRLGLAIKGAGWFGVFGGIFSFGVGAWSGSFALWQVILFVSLLPVVKWLGVAAFNSPQKPKENRFPPLYFSQSRFEVWGGLVALCLYFCIFGSVTHVWLMPLMTAFGMLSGALGFWLGNLFQTALDGSHESGLFALLRRPGIFSSWKGMECIFGAVGGLGIGAGWCLLYLPFSRRYIERIISHSGIWSAFSEKTDNILLFVWLFLFALYVLRYMFPQDKGRFGRALHKTEDIWVYPVFCYVPLFLAACGNTAFAGVFSVSVMLFLLAEKIAFSGAEHYESLPGAKIWQAVLVGITAVCLALQLFLNFSLSAYWMLFVWLLSFVVVYICMQVVGLFCSPDGKRAFRGSISWMVWAVVCVAAVLIPGWFYFHI